MKLTLLNCASLKAGYSLMVLGVVACGSVHADKQKNSRMEKPDFQIAEQGFFLADGHFDKEFFGSSIIWSDKASVKGVAEVAKVSSELIRNGVKQLQYLDAEVLPLKAEFEKLLPAVVEKQTAIVMKSYESAALAAATWFSSPDEQSGEVPKIARWLGVSYGEKLTDQDKILLRTNFSLYCQAKIWERATKANLIFEEYRGRRPTPSGLCEGVYQHPSLKLILSSSSSCSAGKDYKNYFSCLWHEGVKKTSLWKMRYPPESDAAKAFNSLSDRSLMAYFAKFDNTIFLRQTGTIEIPDLDRGGKVKIPLAFVPAESGLMKYSVGKIISNIELQPISDDETTRFFRLADRNEAAVEYLLKAEADLRDDMRQFNLLKADHYLNENRFNLVFQKPSPSALAIKESFTTERQAQAVLNFPSIFDITLPEVDQLKADLGPMVAQLKDIGQKALQRSQEVGEPRTECKSAQQSLGCAYKSLTEKAKDVVMPEDVSRAVWQSSVRLSKSADGSLLLAEVKINQIGTYISKSCVKIDENASATCPASKDGSTLSFDADTGNVTLTVPIVDVAKQAVQKTKRADFKSNFSFSEIPEEQLRSAKMVFSATLSLVDKVLLTLIGDVVIISEDHDGKEIQIAHGAIKLRETRPTQQVQAEAFKLALESLRASGF